MRTKPCLGVAYALQKIEAEASESVFLRNESPKNLLGASRAALGLAVCGPVLLTAPQKNALSIRSDQLWIWQVRLPPPGIF
jgi:hypothetical protein